MKNRRQPWIFARIAVVTAESPETFDGLDVDANPEID